MEVELWMLDEWEGRTPCSMLATICNGRLEAIALQAPQPIKTVEPDPIPESGIS